MTKQVVDKHQELLDEFAKAVLPSVYNEVAKFAEELVEINSNLYDTVSIESYKIAQAMVKERSRLIQLRRECEYKQRMNIADCDSCPERGSCNK